MSNYLMYLPLLRSSLCLIILLDTRMLNNSLCLNICGDAASKLYKDCCPSEVLSLNIVGGRSIVNGNSLPISTTDRAISATSAGPAFQAYSTNNTH